MRQSKEISEQCAAVARSWAEGTSSEPLTIVKLDGGGGVTCLRGYGAADVTGQEAARILGVSYPTFRARYVATGRLVRGKVSGKFAMKRVLDLRGRQERGYAG